MLRECGEQCAGPRQEDARVPQHMALQQQGLGRGRRGLFNETCHLAAAICALIALLDVAVRTARKTGHHTEGDDGTGLSRRNPFANGFGEGGCIGDVVIRRAEQQERVGVVGRTGQQSCQGHRSGGVARGGLQQHLARHVFRFNRISHQEAVVLSGHANDRVVAPGEAVQCQLQQALVADQGHELFGKTLTAQRPQAGA